MAVLEPHHTAHAIEVLASRRIVTTLYDLVELGRPKQPIGLAHFWTSVSSPKPTSWHSNGYDGAKTGQGQKRVFSLSGVTQYRDLSQ